MQVMPGDVRFQFLPEYQYLQLLYVVFKTGLAFPGFKVQFGKTARTRVGSV
jgi:hypothetical protein